MIYADNAATTQLDLEAFAQMKTLLLDQFANSSQQYSFAKYSKQALKEARKIIADCINADPEEIYFTSGGSESNNWALKKFGTPGKAKIVYASNIEHKSILNINEYNLSLNLLNVNKKGVVTDKELIEKLKNKKFVNTDLLVSIMIANNEIGCIEPIKELVNIVHSYGGIFHTDAVQAVGHIKIDVKDLGIDMLSASAHKFNGPKGIGFLYIKKGTLINSLIDGGLQEYGIRGGTENVAAIVAMAIALKNNINYLNENQKNLRYLYKVFIDKLTEHDIDFTENSNINGLPGLVNISIYNENGESILHRLDLKKIMISTGSACDSIVNQLSHVIKAIKVPKKYASGTIRVSFGKNNTEDEAKIIADEIVKIVKNKKI